MKLPRLKPREVMRRIERAGFVLDHVKGSHYVYLHPLYRRRVVIAMHHKDMKPKTLLSIFKQAGLRKEEFEELK